MNRTGLAITLAIAATVGVVFALWPELDLKLAGVFFDAQRGGF
ncbi:MAG: PAP2 family protein, partial [Alphaproteobacteria bacterium]